MCGRSWESRTLTTPTDCPNLAWLIGRRFVTQILPFGRFLACGYGLWQAHRLTLLPSRHKWEGGDHLWVFLGLHGARPAPSVH